MQFTQVEQAESFKQDYQQTRPQIYIHQQQHFQIYKNQEYKTILNDIQSINHARSLIKGIEEQHQNQVIDINDTDLEVQEPDLVFLPVASIPNFMRKSNMFSSKRSAEGSESSLLTFQSKTIKIYYMCTPIHKFIQYTSTTTAQSLISKALHLYTKDLSLDQKILQFVDPKSTSLIDIEYELRFPIEEGNYLPDFEVDAVHKDRLIFEGFFQAFILVVKNSNNLKQNNEKTDLQEKTGKMRLNIFNEANMQVTSLILNKEDTLQKAIDYLQAELNQKITLTEQLEVDLSLPSDLDIKNLGTCKLYAKKKRFLDEPLKEKVPLKIISSIPRDLSAKIQAPIGISQASRYEEFEVTKVNSRGAYQQRIIGFDQTKMYNYEPSVRKKNKQPSLLKIILGGNTLTGTKKPETLISEIRGVNCLEGHSFEIIFNDKRTTFITDTQDKKQKIMRKLKFLIEFNNKPTKV